MDEQGLESSIRSAVPMTALQRAYVVGRKPDLPLGGVDCLAYVEFRGRNFDVLRLQHAVDQVHRNAALRGKFVLAEEALIEDGAVPAPKVVLHDTQEAPAQEREQIRECLMRKAIDIEHGINWGICLSSAGQNDQVLHLVFSLAAIDVVALGRVLHELAEAYEAKCTRQDDVFDSVATLWDELQTNFRHRLGRCRDSVPLLSGPELVGLCETPTGDVSLETLRGELNQQEWEGLTSRARELGVSTAALILTVYEGALRRWSNNDDFCVTIAGLDVRGTENLIVDRTVAYAHRAVAAGDFEQEVQGAASDLRRRLIEKRDVMTEMREAQAVGFPVAASRCVFTYAAEMTVFTPLVIEVLGRPRTWGQTPQSAIDCRLVRIDDETLEVAFDVRTSAMPLHIAEAIFELFLDNLREVVETGSPQSSLPRSQSELRKQLNKSSLLTSQLIYEEFRRRVVEQPAAIAVEESKQYLYPKASLTSGVSYAELDRRALAFAGRITQLASPGSLIAVQLPRGIDQIVAILGILYAGCAYLPLSPEAPAARLERIYERSQWKLLVTPELFGLEDEALPLENPFPINETDLAYVIFTSGSTGEPKGVSISHAAAANTITDVTARNGFDSQDIFLGVSGIDFDLSVYDIFGALGAGAKLILLDESENRDPFCWGKVVRNASVTVWNSVPMLLQMLFEANDSLPSLRTFLISGDWIPLELPAMSRGISPGSTFVAMGGATEGSIWSNEYVIREDADLKAEWPSVPYGRPLTGQKYRVVDPKGRDCPDECIGELLIGGVGVAQGYYRDRDRTQAVFVEDLDGQRWYRTGDLGVWREGILFFVGRQDNQVKIRGHRVECGEVESRLCEYPGVGSVAVVPIRDRSALAAMYVPDETGLTLDPSELSAYLSAELPWYMIPAVFFSAAELPITGNGKVDRSLVANLATQGQEKIIAPSEAAGSIQSLVAACWATTLEVPIEYDSNFFALGGDSLTATRMCAQLREAGVQAELANLFRAPTLADFIDTCQLAKGDEKPLASNDKKSISRPSWRERAAAENASLESLGITEWCRWVWWHELELKDGPETVLDKADFFALGGDSLTAARVCAALRTSGIEASVATLFRHPQFKDFWRQCELKNEEEFSKTELEPAPEGDEPFDLTPLQLAYVLGSDGIPGVVRTTPCVAVIINSDDPIVAGRWGQALAEVVSRHEVLRLVRCEDWRQRVVSSAEPEFAEIPFHLTDEEFRDLLRRTSVDDHVAPAVRGFVRRDRPQELGLVFNYLSLDSLSVAAILRDLAETVIGSGKATGEVSDIGVFRRYAPSRSDASSHATLPAPTMPILPIEEIPESAVVFDSLGHLLNAECVQKLREYARRHSITLNSMLLGAYSAALATATGQQRITVNIPTANRPAETPDSLGQFSDLALCECGSEMSSREIHARLGEAVAQAGTVAFESTTQRQRYPIVFTSLLGSPLAEDLAGGVVRAIWTHTRTPAVLIDCQVMPTAQQGIELRWDYPRKVLPEGFLEDAFADFIDRVHNMSALGDLVGSA